MKPRRIAAEFLREARRPSAWIFLAGYVLTAGLVALALESILELELYFIVTYLWMPLLFAPWAARLASRDRDRGFAPVLATTPLTDAEQTLARIAFMAAFVLVAVLLTGPISLLSPPTPSEGFARRAVQFFAWGFYVGGSSAIAGLIIGAVFSKSSPMVMTLGSLSVLGQYLVGAITPFLVGQVSIGRGVFALLHLTPLLWPMEFMGLVEGYEVVSKGRTLGGAFAAFLLELMALVLVMSLQNRSGWQRPRSTMARRWTAALSSIVLLLGALLVILTPTVQTFEESLSPYFSTKPVRAGLVTVNVSFLNLRGADIVHWGGEDDFADILHGEPVVLYLGFQGQPNRTVALTNLRLFSPDGELTPTSELPATVKLNETGFAEVHIQANAELVVIRVWWLPVDVTFTVDGAPVHAQRLVFFGPDRPTVWPIPHPLATIAAACLPLIVVPAAVLFHRRANRWSP